MRIAFDERIALSIVAFFFSLNYYVKLKKTKIEIQFEMLFWFWFESFSMKVVFNLFWTAASVEFELFVWFMQLWSFFSIHAQASEFKIKLFRI